MGCDSKQLYRFRIEDVIETSDQRTAGGDVCDTCLEPRYQVAQYGHVPEEKDSEEENASCDDCVRLYKGHAEAEKMRTVQSMLLSSSTARGRPRTTTYGKNLAWNLSASPSRLSLCEHSFSGESLLMCCCLLVPGSIHQSATIAPLSY